MMISVTVDGLGTVTGKGANELRAMDVIARKILGGRATTRALPEGGTSWLLIRHHGARTYALRVTGPVWGR